MTQRSLRRPAGRLVSLVDAQGGAKSGAAAEPAAQTAVRPIRSAPGDEFFSRDGDHDRAASPERALLSGESSTRGHRGGRTARGRAVSAPAQDRRRGGQGADAAEAEPTPGGGTPASGGVHAPRASARRSRRARGRRRIMLRSAALQTTTSPRSIDEQHDVPRRTVGFLEGPDLPERIAAAATFASDARQLKRGSEPRMIGWAAANTSRPRRRSTPAGSRNGAPDMSRMDARAGHRAFVPRAPRVRGGSLWSTDDGRRDAASRGRRTPAVCSTD